MICCVSTMTWHQFMKTGKSHKNQAEMCTFLQPHILPTSEKNTLKIITCQNRSRRLQLKKLPQNLYHISIHHLQIEMKFNRKKILCSNAIMHLCWRFSHFLPHFTDISDDFISLLQSLRGISFPSHHFLWITFNVGGSNVGARESSGVKRYHFFIERLNFNEGWWSLIFLLVSRLLHITQCSLPLHNKKNTPFNMLCIKKVSRNRSVSLFILNGVISTCWLVAA